MTLQKEELFTESDLIDPNWVISYLSTNLPRKNVCSEDVLKIVRRMCRRTQGVRVKFKRVRSLRDCYAVAGVFDDEKHKAIEIEICCSSLKKKFTLNKKIYKKLLFDIADTLCHESIHRYQHQSRHYNSDRQNSEPEEYYSDPDEIFAYSVNIAHSLYRHYGRDAIDKLNEIELAVDKDYYFSDYYSLFYQQPIFNKLLKLVYLHLIAIDEGKICHRP